MTELEFTCFDAVPRRYAAVPTLQFRLRISDRTQSVVHALALHCQIRIEPHRRGYADDEADLLSDLFGPPHRWEQWQETLQPVQLAQASVVLPGFAGGTETELSVPCSYDLEVAAGQYLHALGSGEVPLLLLFSGTVFVEDGDRHRVAPVPWHAEAEYRLPLQVWRTLLDQYFPGSGWLRLRRDTIDALLRYKAQRAVGTWDDAVTRLLTEAEGVQP